ncbi:MAG: deacetylase sulfotransferase [marine bacterium B5-7]|nr:MAG: deacetylase sulfotransferase [marine bacterium B5-7]
MVNFVIAGAQKSGTTALGRYLQCHREVLMPTSRKELHFFDNDELFQQGEPDYSIYHADFENPGYGVKVVGEATPIYMYWRPVPARIFQYNRRMKWIILLRNPITRAYSHWNMDHRRGMETHEFMDALMMELEDMSNPNPSCQSRTAYIRRGLYSEQLELIYRYFPKDQVFVEKSERLEHDPETVINNICEFLKLSPLENVELRREHETPYLKPLGTEARRILCEFYRSEIHRLEETLGWNCRQWLEGGESDTSVHFENSC